MLRLAFDFIITWRETRTRPNAYSLHVFGGFLFTPVTSFSRNDYGGSVAFDITDSFGTELGIRGYREYPFECGGVTPILMPYYKFEKHKVEMDFGGLLQEIIYGLFK
ncbi:hypothetical protein NXY41_09935 [Bacteroides fragilis]|nr:hypothetical protein [Bacteroides fragilis]MCS2878910.1 hypothetical protein [Bacteroides fragilis]